MKRFCTVILFFAFVLFIMGCEKKSSKSSDSIFVNMGAEPRTIDPTLNSQSAVSTYLFHAFEGLTKKDKNNELKPGMAENWNISDDGLTYTFHLRTNAKWSDGKPVTANDFVYAFKRAVDPKTAAEYAYMMEVVKNAKNITKGNMNIDNLGVKALDDYTLEVKLENPTAYFLEFISSTGVYMPVREDIINKYADNWTKNPESYVVNGPYVMTERKADESIVFEINTNYYAKDEQVAKKITFVLLDDPNTALAGVKTGTLHFSAVPPPSGEIETLMKEGYVVPNYALGTYYIEINITNDVLKNKDIRKALSLAIDRNYIVSNVAKGGQIPAGAFVPPSVSGLKGSFREEGGNYIDIENYASNIEKAKELMAKAGYPNGEGFPVVELKVSPGFYTLIGEAMQQMWKDNLNVNVSLVQEEFAITLQSLIEKDYQMARMGWTGDYNDPMTILDIMLSYGGVNHTGFNNKEYDRLIQFAKSSKDNAARMDAMHKAEAILFEEMPIIPLFYRTDSIMKNPKLKGVVLDPLARHKFNYAYVE